MPPVDKETLRKTSKDRGAERESLFRPSALLDFMGVRNIVEGKEHIPRACGRILPGMGWRGIGKREASSFVSIWRMVPPFQTGWIPFLILMEFEEAKSGFDQASLHKLCILRVRG